MIHDFVHWLFESVIPWITDLAKNHHAWCFPIAFVVAFSESFIGISFIVPGTVILVTLGAVIGASHISVIPAWAGAVLGSLAGDWICYWLGCRYGHRIRHVRPFNRFEKHIEKGLQFFHDKGIWAIIIGRFLGPFRAVVPLVAGISQVEFWSFQIANGAVAMVWAFAVLSPVGALLRHLLP